MVEALGNVYLMVATNAVRMDTAAQVIVGAGMLIGPVGYAKAGVGIRAKLTRGAMVVAGQEGWVSYPGISVLRSE